MSTYFDWEIAQEPARRQFRASVLMVVAMAAAAVVIGFVTPMKSDQKAPPITANDMFIGRLIVMSE